MIMITENEENSQSFGLSNSHQSWSLSLSGLVLTPLATTGCDQWLLSVLCQACKDQAAPQLEGKIKHFYRRLPTKSLTQFWKLTGKNRNNIDETCHTQNYVSSQKCIFKPSDSGNGLTGQTLDRKNYLEKLAVVDF